VGNCLNVHDGHDVWTQDRPNDGSDYAQTWFVALILVSAYLDTVSENICAHALVLEAEKRASMYSNKAVGVPTNHSMKSQTWWRPRRDQPTNQTRGTFEQTSTGPSSQTLKLQRSQLLLLIVPTLSVL